MYTSSVAQILEPYGHLPKKIQQAILRVETHPHFIGLTRAMKAVLKVLVSYSDQHDASKPFRVVGPYAAEQAKVSTKSVQRTINALKDAGWMSQHGDGRESFGEFAYREYRFSEVLCQAIQLPYGPNNVPPAQAETTLSDGTVYDLNFKEDQRAIALKRRVAAQGKITLPPLLEQMAEKLKIKPSGICKLRGMAHEAGYKLEDIYIAIQHNLERIAVTATNAFNYLRAVILNPRRRDFRTMRAKLEHSKNGSLLSARAAKFSNKRYATVCGLTKVTVFDHTAEIVTHDGKVSTAVGTAFEDVLDRIERGDFIPYNPTATDLQEQRQVVSNARAALRAAIGNLPATSKPCNDVTKTTPKDPRKIRLGLSSDQEKNKTMVFEGTANLAPPEFESARRSSLDEAKRLLASSRAKTCTPFHLRGR